MRDKDRQRRETVTPAYFSSPGCSHHPAPVQCLAPGKHTHTSSLFHSLTSNVSLLANTHTHTFIVSQLNIQCLAPGKHTHTPSLFQSLTANVSLLANTHTTFIVSELNSQCLAPGKHTHTFIVSQLNSQCLTPGKHTHTPSLFHSLTANVSLLANTQAFNA